MSRIYEALKDAEHLRSRNGLVTEDSLRAMEVPELRGSPRHDLNIGLTVYGHAAGEKPFHDLAIAMNGNVNGGLMLLGVPVYEGQALLLINNQTSQEQICSVVNVRVRDAQSSEVSVAFVSPNSEFWELSGVPCDSSKTPTTGGC